MSKARISLGRTGESWAVSLLRDNNYRILVRNYRSRLGEIDIIAKDRDVICFVEVKARSSNTFGLPAEAVSLHKQKQISRVALGFLKERRLMDRKSRFDVISVDCSEIFPRLELIKNAFELASNYTY